MAILYRKSFPVDTDIFKIICNTTGTVTYLTGAKLITTSKYWYIEKDAFGRNISDIDCIKYSITCVTNSITKVLYGQ